MIQELKKITCANAFHHIHGNKFKGEAIDTNRKFKSGRSAYEIKIEPSKRASAPERTASRDY